MNTMTIYGKTNCQWCKEAKNLAKKYDILYEYIDVGYTEARKELLGRKPDARTVPQIWWNGRYIGGYQELVKEIENTLGGFGEQKI